MISSCPALAAWTACIASAKTKQVGLSWRWFGRWSCGMIPRGCSALPWSSWQGAPPSRFSPFPVAPVRRAVCAPSVRVRRWLCCFRSGLSSQRAVSSHVFPLIAESSNLRPPLAAAGSLKFWFRGGGWACSTLPEFHCPICSCCGSTPRLSLTLTPSAPPQWFHSAATIVMTSLTPTTQSRCSFLFISQRICVVLSAIVTKCYWFIGRGVLCFCQFAT